MLRKCKPGYFCTGVAAKQTECPLGKYALNSQSAQCIDCSPGMFAKEQASVECKDCTAGMYRERKNKGGDKINGASCDVCPRGWSTSSNRGATSCQECPAGTFGGDDENNNNNGKSACQECAAGKYRGNENTDLTRCLSCPAGYATSLTRQPFCMECDAGQFASIKEAHSCTKCPSNQFQDEKRSISCKTCKSDAPEPNEQHTACVKPNWKIPSDCKPGLEYLNDTAGATTSVERMQWKCVSCPLGADCAGHKTYNEIVPLIDYYRVPWADDKFNAPFEKCPFPNDCNASKVMNTSCKIGTVGVLCAVCSPNYIRRSGCVRCDPNNDTTRIVSLVGIAIFVLCILTTCCCCCRARLKRLKRKYGTLWRDVVRIVTIVVSFMQISTSLPSVLPQFSWPEAYVEFLSMFDVLNVDFLSVLGLPCVADVDFRTNVMVAGLIPVTILMIAALMFCVQHFRLARVAKQITNSDTRRKEAAEFLFDVMDTDGDEKMNVQEFQHLLASLGDKEKTFREAASLLCQVKQKHPLDSGGRAVLLNRKNGDSKTTSLLATNELSRHQFVNAVTDGQIEGLVSKGSKWASIVEEERTKTSYKSTLMLVFLLIHAPVSQRVFQYFATHNVKGRHYLRSDYSIQYGSQKWLDFLPAVLAIAFAFTVALPVVMASILWINRKHFYTIHNQRRWGFLYKSFVRGAEFWEVHELVRKATLTGILIYVPTSSRSAVAVLVCVLAVASLNFSRPHKNSIVFWVAEISFLLTTFKYLICVFVVLSTAIEEDGINKTDDTLGIILIGLDIIVVAGSGCAICAVMIVLWRGAKRNETSTAAAAAVSVVDTLNQVIPKEGDRIGGPEVKMKLVLKTKVKRATMLKRVQSRTAHRVFDEAHESAMKQREVVEQRKLKAQSRLQQRVKRRSTMRQQVVVVPKSDEERGVVEDTRRKSAERIRRSVTDI
jgi:hypothetical protein